MRCKIIFVTIYISKLCYRARVVMFNATFNNISVIMWRPVLLVEETGVPGENHRTAASRWQTLSHNAVSSTPCLDGIRTHLNYVIKGSSFLDLTMIQSFILLKTNSNFFGRVWPTGYLCVKIISWRANAWWVKICLYHLSLLHEGAVVVMTVW
jgi:hypothetical protein